MKYKHIIWDYNGTILDDVDVVLDILNIMLKKRNLSTYNIEEYREIFDFPIRDYYIKAGFDLDIYDFHELADEFITLYNEMFEKCYLREGIVELLNYFYQAGYTQSVLTAGKEKDVIKQLKKFNAEKYFLKVTGETNILARGKINLIPLHMKHLEVKNPEIVFIGDTTHDFEVAKNIGCDCLLLLNGHQNLKRLKETGAMIGKNSKDIISLIER